MQPAQHSQETAMWLTDLRNWLWDNFGWELIDWAEGDIRF